MRDAADGRVGGVLTEDDDEAASDVFTLLFSLLRIFAGKKGEALTSRMSLFSFVTNGEGVLSQSLNFVFNRGKRLCN